MRHQPTLFEQSSSRFLPDSAFETIMLVATSTAKRRPSEPICQLSAHHFSP